MGNSNEENYTYLKDANDRIYEQLTYAEAKHAVVIGLLGAAIFAIIGIIIDIFDSNLMWLQILLGIMAFSMLIAIIVSLSSFYPDRKKIKNAEKSNLFFYSDIAQISDGEKYIQQLGQADINKHLAEQNIKVAQIIEQKHRKFRIVLNLLLASILLPYYIALIVKLIVQIIRKKKNNNSI